VNTTRAAILAVILAGAALCPIARAEDSSDLAQDLTNPVADLLTIPIQLNYDQNIGPVEDGWKLQANFVLPKP
jgi:hypothetical protein